jgi:hypothetical protein
MRDVKLPTPVAAGAQRFVIVSFERVTSATIAHNCIHGAYLPSPTDPKTFTRLNTGYEQPIRPHLVRDWLSSHPRIVFPILAFLIGTLTYAVRTSTFFFSPFHGCFEGVRSYSCHRRPSKGHGMVRLQEYVAFPSADNRYSLYTV